MKKKQYLMPETEILDMRFENPLLTASSPEDPDPGANNPPGFGGNGDEFDE